jgi:hypothetical protein
VKAPIPPQLGDHHDRARAVCFGYLHAEEEMGCRRADEDFLCGGEFLIFARCLDNIWMASTGW